MKTQDKVEKVKRPHAIYFTDRTRSAKQSFKEQCDVKKIVEQFNKTGQLINAAKSGKPIYGDFTNVPDLATAYLASHTANNFFENLPEKIRREFKDVNEFFRFLSEPKNKDRAIELGILKKVEPEKEKVQKVEVVNQSTETKVDDKKA